MPVPYEKDLRELLARNLALLEPDLRLVETEYPLPNAVGTRGRIDILARDGHGSWVVIELKRADGTAREALNEVTKYTELLRRELRLRQDRIRSVIVSTTWRELLVPVSNMARDWAHDLRGYHLILNKEGIPAQAQRVPFLPPTEPPRVTPHHFIYLFNSPEDRDRGWQDVVSHAADAGAHDLLAADFKRVRETDRVVAPYGLYFAIGQMNPDYAPDDVLEASQENEGGARGYPLEYEALCNVTRNVFGASYDSARPGLLRQLHEDPNWEIEDFRTTGAFTLRSPLDERDLLRDLNGDEEGIGDILYTGTARTTNRARWPVFMKEHKLSLGGNPDWEALVDAWLNDVASEPIESDVLLHVYNPCDLISALLRGWPDKLVDKLPMVSGTALRSAGVHRSIRGALYWNGTPVLDLAGRIRLTYPDHWKWVSAGYGGMTWAYDLRLLESLGLSYILFEYIGENPFDHQNQEVAAIWAVIDGAPQRVPAPFGALHQAGWRKICSLDVFARDHREQIDVLVQAYRHKLSFENP